jgi:hypothetical protein
MRYWGILGAKLVGATLLLYAVWVGLSALYTPPEYLARWNHSPFMHDLGWTGMMLLFNLLVQGILFVIIWDQRYRCRTCGRRLRMPVQTGRYAQMLLYGRPKLEYICTYGHGTLKVPELHFSGKEPIDWQEHEDIWKELYSFDTQEKK